MVMASATKMKLLKVRIQMRQIVIMMALTIWFRSNMDPMDGTDATADSDGDGISNGDEVLQGTNASSADSDGDGIGDLNEIIAEPTRKMRTRMAMANRMVQKSNRHRCHRCNDVVVDSDGDGLSDAYEAGIESRLI